MVQLGSYEESAIQAQQRVIVPVEQPLEAVAQCLVRQERHQRRAAVSGVKAPDL